MNIIAEVFTLHRFLTRMTLAVAALTTATFLLACDRTDRKPAGLPEKITVAYATVTETAIAQIAESQGYYRDEGLEVIPHLHPYGKPAFEDLLAGKADFATVAETPVMFAIMKGEKISVIATIQTSSLSNAIVARRDRGILTPGDLKGKKIAVTLGTTLDFFIDSILGVHGVSRKDVEIIDLKVGEMADALARGDVDAISTFAHYKAFTQNKLGDRVITFQDKNIYRETYNVVTTQEFIRKNPNTVKKLLRSLIKADKFVRENPMEAQNIVAKISGIEISVVRNIWSESNFTATLDQPLLLSLEDESRWAINSGLTSVRNVPNYLDYIYIDGLKSVKPDAVNILK